MIKKIGMYFVDKNNKLWFYFVGSFYFITFVQKILAFVEKRTILYVSDTKKYKGSEQIVYFNWYHTAHFKSRSEEPGMAYDIGKLTSVLDIGFKSTSMYFMKNETYELIAHSHSEHHIIRPCSLNTGIDTEKYIILYGESMTMSHSDLKWSCSDSLFVGYKIYYIGRRNSYENTLVIKCNNYSYFCGKDIGSVGKFGSPNTTEKNVDLGSGTWYHASREYITDDDKYVSMITLEEYESIHPNIYSTLGCKSGQYFLGDEQMNIDTSDPQRCPVF